ncbi:MAG: tetratricopeptide repeat protein [Gemmatimonadaceae bacterium]
MRRPIHFADEPRRNYLPFALTGLAVLAIFACDGKDSEQRVATASSQPPVVVDGSVREPVVETPATTFDSVAYGEAESRFSARRYGEATEMFIAYVSRRPENPWGYYMLGLSAWKSGQLPRARESFVRALELDPSHVKSLLNLSRVLLEMNEPAEASERVIAALRIDSTSADAHRLTGRVRVALGESDGAIESYRTALSLDTRDVWSMNNLGLLFIQLGRFEEALGPLARAAQLDSGVAVFRNNFGMALERTGHFVAAADAYRTAVEIDPGYSKASASLTRITGRGDDPHAEPIDVSLLAEDFVRDLETWKAERVAVSEPVTLPVESPTPPEQQ